MSEVSISKEQAQELTRSLVGQWNESGLSDIILALTAYIFDNSREGYATIDTSGILSILIKGGS